MNTFDVHAGPEYPAAGDRGIVFTAIRAESPRSAVSEARRQNREGGYSDYPRTRLIWTAVSR